MSKEKIIIAELDLPEADVEIGEIRRYNLGGFNNYIEFTAKVIGPAKEIQKNKNIDYLIGDVTRRMGDTFAKARMKIKLLTGEEYDDDGTVVDKKDE